MAVRSRIGGILFGGYEPRLLVPDVGLTVVRVFAGLALALAHGWAKVSDPGAVPGLAAGVGFPQVLDTPLSWAAALTEFVGGLLLALGLFTRPAAFFILINMSVAAYFHIGIRGDPFVADVAQRQPGYELALFFWVVALQFVLAGSGRLSLDHLVRSRG